MQKAFVCLILAVGVVAGLALFNTHTTQTFAAPVQPADQASSLVGQSVQVNFRQADDISFPYPHDGKAHLLAKLEDIQGTVIEATSTWIELRIKDGSRFTYYWVPISSVAYVNSVEPSKVQAAAQPSTR